MERFVTKLMNSMQAYFIFIILKAEEDKFWEEKVPFGTNVAEHFGTR